MIFINSNSLALLVSGLLCFGRALKQAMAIGDLKNWLPCEKAVIAAGAAITMPEVGIDESPGFRCFGAAKEPGSVTVRRQVSLISDNAPALHSHIKVLARDSTQASGFRDIAAGAGENVLQVIVLEFQSGILVGDGVARLC